MSSPELPSPPPRTSPRRRFKSLVDAELLNEELPPQTLVERVRQYMATGGFGFGVSLLVHAVILIALGFVIFNVRVANQLDTVITDFMQPGAEKAGGRG